MRVHRLDDIEFSHPFIHPGGTSVTKIIGDIMETLYPKRYRGELDPLRARMGYSWEDALAHTLTNYERHIVRPKRTLELDGIIGHVDGINVRDPAVVETKLTYASANREIEDPFFLYWHMQGQAYCHMLGLDETEYHVIFIVGDYTRPYNPAVKSVRITWSEHELEENWHCLRLHARDKGWL